jgi:hypothetical protein
VDLQPILTTLESLEARINAVQEAARSSPSRVKWSAAIEAFHGVFNALALVLSVRIMLLLALSGGFFLAVTAMQRQTPISVIVLVAYALLVIGPAAFLEYGKKISTGMERQN